MESNLQTHTIPADGKSLHRLAALMGFGTAREFEAARASHTREVRRVYDNLLRGKPTPARVLPGDFQEAEVEWKNILVEHSFKDVAKSFHLVQTFVRGPGYVHVSPRVAELAQKLLARFLKKCPRASQVSECVGEWVSGSSPRQPATHSPAYPLT